MTRTYRIQPADSVARARARYIRQRDERRAAFYSPDDLARMDRIESLRADMRNATTRDYASEYYQDGAR